MIKLPAVNALVFVGCFFVSPCLTAQEEMNVDLADQAISPQLLESGKFQGEFAYSYTEFLSDQKLKCVNPLINLRYGLFKRFELGITIEEGKNRDPYVENTVQGIYPLSLNGKISLFKNQKTALAFISFIQLPFTAHEKKQTYYWSPMCLLGAEQKIGESFKMTLNAGIKQQPYESEFVVPVNYAAEFKLNDLLTIFANYYGQFPFDKKPQHNAGLGVELQLSEDFEVFATGGRSLSPEDENFFLSAGLAFRL